MKPAKLLILLMTTSAGLPSYGGERTENPRVGGSIPSQATNLRAAYPKTYTGTYTEYGAALGVTLHRSQVGPEVVPALDAAGLRMVRLSVAYWWGPGLSNEWGRPAAAMLDRLPAAGITPILVLGGYSPGDDPNPAPPVTAEDRALFAAWAGSVAARWPHAVYEIWNEPNLPNHWTATPDPVAYMALVAETAEAIRRAAPQARILGGAYGPLSHDHTWLRQVIDLGMLEHIDALSIHPYVAGDPDNLPAFLEEMRQLVRRSKWERPIVVSEWGVDVDSEGHSEALQADWTRRALEAFSREGIDLAVLYEWKDSGDTPYQFGLHRADGSPRPVVAELR